MRVKNIDVGLIYTALKAEGLPVVTVRSADDTAEGVSFELAKDAAKEQIELAAALCAEQCRIMAENKAEREEAALIASITLEQLVGLLIAQGTLKRDEVLAVLKQ